MKKDIKEIEVIEPEILTQNNSNNMETVTAKKPDLSSYTADELLEMAKAKQAEQNKEQQKKQQAFKIEKDTFLKATAGEFRDYSDKLAALKEDVLTKANQLYEQMFELHGKEVKEQKSFTLTTEDDQFKIEVERAERFKFTEEASVHIQSIQEIFKAKFEGRNKAFYNFLDRILLKGSKDEYDPKLLAKARKEARELGSDELMSELDKLQLCQRVVGSAMYCRVYQKGPKGGWQNINIQFSRL